MSSNSLKYAVFSFIIPGLGHYLNADEKKGLTLFAGAVFIHLFIWFFMNNPFGSVLSTLYHVYAGWDCYKKY